MGTKGSLRKKLFDNGHFYSQLWDYQRGKCCYCEKQMMIPQPHVKGRQVHPRSATVEHLKRKSDGGTGAQLNLRIACIECNSSRGSKNWLEWKTIRLGEWDEIANAQKTL